MRRERAVLAVAPAGARQRDREVAREGDALHAGVYALADLPPRPAEPLRTIPPAAGTARSHPSSGERPLERLRANDVYLARHGQTAYNLAGRFPGAPARALTTPAANRRTNSPSAPAHRFTALWSSPLLRARDSRHRRRRIGLTRRGPAPDRDGRGRVDGPDASTTSSHTPAVRRIRGRRPDLCFPRRRVFRATGAAGQRRAARRRTGRPAGAGRLSRDGHSCCAARPRRHGADRAARPERRAPPA